MFVCVNNGAREFLEVKRCNDRVMLVSLVWIDCMWNVMSSYALQVGNPDDVKGEFMIECKELLASVPENENLVVGSHINAHVGCQADDWQSAWWAWVW